MQRYTFHYFAIHHIGVWIMFITRKSQIESAIVWIYLEEDILPASKLGQIKCIQFEQFRNIPHNCLEKKLNDLFSEETKYPCLKIYRL